MDCEISLPFKNLRFSKTVVFISKLKQWIYNLRKDLVFSLKDLSTKGCKFLWDMVTILFFL